MSLIIKLLTPLHNAINIWYRLPIGQIDLIYTVEEQIILLFYFFACVCVEGGGVGCVGLGWGAGGEGLNGLYADASSFLY